MNKKLLIATAIIVPSLAVGGLWVYQASLFENSISQQLSQAQETLKTYGVSFRYDDLRVSRYLFQAHLINPTVSGTVPKLGEILKDVKGFEGIEKLEGLEGTVLIKGEMTACFSPISNTVTVKTDGDSHFTVQGPLEFNLSMPKPKDASFVIQRKDYDFFGKNPFLSFHNIKGVYSDSKGMSLLLDDQKLLDIKDSAGQVSLDWKGKAFDISVSTDTHGMQIFKIEKGIKGKIEGLDVFNEKALNEIEVAAALGSQDQKISASFHLDDFLTYVDDVKLIFADTSNKFNPQFIEKLFPEGIRLEIKDYSTENKVYQTSMKVSLGKSNGYFPIKLSGDFKVTDQWATYWQDYFKVMVKSLADAELPEGIASALKGEGASKTCMPELQSFGKMSFSGDFEIPATLSTPEDKGTLEFKSDLYDLSAVGVLNGEGGSVKLKTRNASSLMADVENYVARVSGVFSQSYPAEVQNVKGLIKGGQNVLDKILEPSGAAQQSIHIQVGKEGVKVGNYDLMQVMALFGAAMESENRQVEETHRLPHTSP